jgi:Holliday junction resolvasome RuvABC ATP-dependent DNA helicase subunit
MEAAPRKPNSSPRFTGRRGILTKLREHFTECTNDERRIRKHFLLHGMGGIGKTQICLRFIEEMSDQ